MCVAYLLVTLSLYHWSWSRTFARQFRVYSTIKNGKAEKNDDDNFFALKLKITKLKLEQNSVKLLNLS